MNPEHPELLFRAWETGDGERLYTLNADPRVLQWTGDLPFKDVAEAEAFVQNYRHFEVHGFGRWWVFRQSDGECLGWCGLRKTSHGIDFGLRWYHRHWNQGYGKSAGRAVLAWADAQQLGTLHAQHHPENRASKKLLVGLGFTTCPPYVGSDAGWKTYQLSWPRT